MNFVDIILNIHYVWNCISNCIYYMKIDLMVMVSLKKKMDILYGNWFDGNGEFEKQLKIDKSCLS